jgi:hypothetical protein
MNTSPLVVTGWAYSNTSVRFVVPLFAIAPRLFSRIVVSPPALLPAEGLLSISWSLRAVYCSHHLMRAISLSAIAGVSARRVSRCSPP